MVRVLFIMSLVFLWAGSSAISAEPVFAHAAFSDWESNIQQRDEQIRYRFGKIRVDGAKIFTSEQIIRFSGVKSKAVASPEIIERVAEHINKAHANRGYIRAKIDIAADYTTVSPEKKEGIVDIVITIDEGPVFVLRRLEFVGNATTRDRIVRRRVLLQIGEPYSEQLMGKSLQRLNGLGRFEKITRENVKIEVDEERHIVDLVIYLKEKAKR
ncbi:MAG: hypothetical protein L0229_19875 [Blastocatellia bacterium]|nr:hypothetical protein [Blastocatellia bacterium]